MATPGTEACDAVGGALKPKWREWPSRAIRRVLSERVAFDILPSMIDAKREDHFLQDFTGVMPPWKPTNRD
jgi:hypothetical protein